MNSPVTSNLTIGKQELVNILAAHNMRLINVLAESSQAELGIRGSQLLVTADTQTVERLSTTIGRLEDLLRAGIVPEEYDIRQAYKASMKTAGPVMGQTVLAAGKKALRAKSAAQESYIAALKNKDLVFATGPAGTGKTYLAMAMAVAAFQARTYERIILTRPAVEAGEKLGFLPGDLAQKVDPYLRPLYDALRDMMEYEQLEQLFDKGLIEVAPLAFMRGRTLNKAFIVLDEAQNCTREQMKMFLTRLGPNSKAVVTGDVTQIDLPNNQPSGLIEALKILKDIPEIGFCEFNDCDVVRHPLVAKIVRAYQHSGAAKG